MRFGTEVAFLAGVSALTLTSSTTIAGGDRPGDPPTCPSTATAALDGCATSNPGATTLYRDFFTGYAAQSRQGNYRVRPRWNVAGVDYPVGFYTPLAKLKDVRKIQPSGCKLQALGGTQVLWCRGAGELVISGYRFDLSGGTWLYLDGAGYTSIKINDSYFLNGPATDRVNGELIVVGQSDATLIVTNSTFDGDGRRQTLGLSYLIGDARKGAQNDFLSHNALFRVPQKGVGTGPCGETIIEDNYFEELEVSSSHGEFTIDGTTECTKRSLIVRYNTMMLPSATAKTGNGGVTALLYLSGGNAKRSWFDVVANNNTLVANTFANGNSSASRLIEENYGKIYGRMEYSANFMDPTGVLLCYYAPRAPVANRIMKGNFNLLDGSKVDDFSSAACHGHHK